MDAGIEIADVGVQILTMLPSPSNDGPLPVACVVISARITSPGRGPERETPTPRLPMTKG
ncbi:hypothetical protein ACIBSW_23045 [Actinoplanes sp. NPDC049668]|uniref:hypothetical protein n=1 Tax=unclassified Actinoplanes TaxID=2626549 RepID=UPI0033B8C867